MRTLKTFCTALFSATLFLGVFSSVAVADGKQPFTATAVQSMKGQQAQSGQIFVSGSKTRFEYSERGRKMVKIILPEQQVMRILFPDEKLYMEIKAPADTPMPASETANPCPTIEGLTCQKVADAKFGDLDVQQWQQHHAPTNTKSTLWWEPVRKMIVRQEFPDGRIMQLALAGKIDFEGRDTERWDISMATSDGKVSTAYRLIDTDLGIIVKEEDPTTGLSRELRGLKVSDSDATWFDVPAGYQRIDAPKNPAQ